MSGLVGAEDLSRTEKKVELAKRPPAVCPHERSLDQLYVDGR